MPDTNAQQCPKCRYQSNSFRIILNVPIPERDGGQSLLKGEPPLTGRFSAPRQAEVEKYSPPFYQFGTIGVVACDRCMNSIQKSNLLVTGQVNGDTSPCSQGDGSHWRL